MSAGNATARRFWSKTATSGDCILWTGGKNQFGYGRFWDGTRTVCAHRWSYEQKFGPIPNELYGMHKCDTPSCVNPDHIVPGTPKDNTQDCIAKGRYWGNPIVYAPSRPCSLSEAAVLEIRKLSVAGASRQELARKFGVSRHLIGLVARGRAWSWVGGPTDAPRGSGRPRQRKQTDGAAALTFKEKAARLETALRTLGPLGEQALLQALGGRR